MLMVTPPKCSSFLRFRPTILTNSEIIMKDICMPSRIFRKLLVDIPPSSNSRSKPKKVFQKKIQSWLDNIDFLKFSKTDKLYGRIFYFNHEVYGVRDIHNIIKPIFDMLQGKVYDDDNDILFFEAIRLDMSKKDSWFKIELDGTATDEIEKALIQTCCLIEVGTLPPIESNAVKLLWLDTSL